MDRIHLFEFEDQSWFSKFLRNYDTDFLQLLSNKTKMYKPIFFLNYYHSPIPNKFSGINFAFKALRLLLYFAINTNLSLQSINFTE